jgi:endonuclease YncB( thermonuclease family)
MLGFLCLTTLFPQTLPAAAGAPRCRTGDYHARVRVKYVIDGDTVKLDSGDSLRLIGLDTPEISHDGRPDEPGARAAANYLKSLLPQHPSVPVVFGAERHDRHGRLLGHLFLRDGTNIQALLLAGGYASPLIIPPNLQFLDCYRAGAAAAMGAHRGIWSYPEYQLIDAAELTPAVRGYRRIRGPVTRTGTSRTSLWINLGKHLALRIVKSDLKYFTGIDLSGLAGITVVARGLVYRRKGQLRMRIRHPLDMQIIPD